MAENLDNTANALKDENQYLYGGFQRISSYDPNMCTTAARFSPYYEKGNTTQPKENSQMTYKNLIYVRSNNEVVHDVDARNGLQHPVDPSKPVDPSYLTYNNEMLIEQQNAGAEVFVENQIENSVTFNDKEQDSSVLCDGVGIDYIQQIEIVELVPINSCETNRLEENEEDGYTMQPYEFPSECNMETLEEHLRNENQQLSAIEEADNQGQILAAQMLEREQQRTLLESTMSPLLAAVNNITQRDAELLSYFNQHDEKEQIMKKTKSIIENNITFRSSKVRDSSEEDDDYILVSDKVVESRARATLPTNYLYLGNVNTDTNEPSVYAKKALPQRTKFGPFEGEIRFTSDIYLNILRSQYPRHYPLLQVGKSRVLIITNENTSNWMRYVRLAQTYSEQNLQLLEENDRIYFKCTRNIQPKEELRVGYHSTYAEKYNLQTLEPSVEDTQKKYELDNPWMCFECDDRFSTSQDMQKHLEVHDVEDASCLISKRKIKRKQRAIKKLSELPKNSSRCFICFKVFMTNSSLKKHFATHLAAQKSKTRITAKSSERSPYKCHLCYRKFGSEEKLTSHQQTHSRTEQKPYKCHHCDQHCATPTALAAHIRSHTNRLYSCVYCHQTFKYVMDFKKHVAQHCFEGSYSCTHCKKKYKEYHLVRKHVRIFHPAVKYPCNECDRLFLHISFLRRHKATHVKKASFQCSECGDKFQSKRQLKQHTKVLHKVKRKMKKQQSTEIPPMENDGSQYLKLTPIKNNSTVPARNNSVSSEDYLQYQFKCEDCRFGFKRRGMLVNHMVKRHPERNINSIEELNQPIVKLQTVFNCPHCPKVYKNNAKRKAHILKNHPGMEVPPSFRSNPILSDINVQTIGCIKTDVQKCQLCYKQYGSRTRLLTHYRKAHKNERVPDIPLTVSPPAQILIEEQCVEPGYDVYRPPVSPENKLLKLSSAALELSSIEDRKFFDFLNERSDTTDITDSNRNNYKMVESEFAETSSNTELNRLPELFEESIACI